MKKGFIANALLIGLGLLVSAIIVYDYVPLSWFEKFDLKKQNFGSALTTIQSTDTISSSRAVINNNFSALNSGKFELSDWYATTTAPQLTTLGTITTGTWNASTLTVSHGGTGSTTLSANQLLLGNGTGAIGVVSGFGTAGQFLTSQGAGAAPTWTTAAINEAGNYNWTGTHSFNNSSNIFLASTTFAGLIASSTVAKPLQLNGVNYAFPSSNGASSTALMTNGSGSLTWNPMDWTLLYSTTTANAYTYATVTISAKSELNIKINVPVLSAPDYLTVRFNSDSTAGNYAEQTETIIGTTASYDSQSNLTGVLIGLTATTSERYFDIRIHNEATRPKSVVGSGEYVSSVANTAVSMVNMGGKWTNTTSQITTVVFFTESLTALPSGTRISIYGGN